jgi:hypothetical protein
VATPAEVAAAYQQRQTSIIVALVAVILALWRGLSRGSLTESWNAGIGAAIVAAVTRAQRNAAAEAPRYLADLALAQGIVADVDRLVPGAFAGYASDGRSLANLLYLPIIAFKRALSAGKSPEEAMAQATSFLAAIAATQVADAGRQAASVGMVANRQWVTYVRVVNLPACSRCILLAGKQYSWSTGFQRHPGCDCGMRPHRQGDDPPETPSELFEQMSPEDQDRRFGKAGAEAIRLGSDIGQIVNARRGMQTATGGRLITTEGTTSRGHAGRKLGHLKKQPGERYRRSQIVRPMPEQLLKDAGGSRDEAIRLLTRFGYLA